MENNVNLFLNRIIYEDEENDTSQKERATTRMFLTALNELNQKKIIDSIKEIGTEKTVKRVVFFLKEVFGANYKLDPPELIDKNFVDDAEYYFDAKTIASVFFLIAFTQKYKNVLTKESKLPENIADGGRVELINTALEKQSSLKPSFDYYYQFFEKQEKQEKEAEETNNINRNEYKLKKTEEIKKVNEILGAVNGFKIDDSLLQYFETYDKSYDFINKILKGEESFKLGKPRSKGVTDALMDFKDAEDKSKIAEKGTGEAISAAASKNDKELGGSDSSNAFGLGVAIPKGRDLIDKNPIDFSQELKTALLNKIKKFSEEHNTLKDELDKLKKDKETPRKNNIRECFKKAGYIIKENDEDDDFGEFSDIKAKFEDLSKKHIDNINKLLKKYNLTDNYKKSIKHSAKVFDAYVDFAYDTALLVREVKNEISKKTKSIKKEIEKNKPMWEDPIKKEFKERERNRNSEKAYEEIKHFLVSGYKSDIKEKVKYIISTLLNHEDIKHTDNILTCLSGPCKGLTSYGFYVGNSGKVFATKKPNSSKNYLVDLSDIVTGEYTNVSTLLDIAGLNKELFSYEDALKKLIEDFEDGGDLAPLKANAEIYTKICDDLRKKIENSTSIVSGKAEEPKDFLQRNSFVINLEAPNGTNGFQFSDDGVEDIALRQMLKGYVLYHKDKSGTNYYVATKDVWEKYQSLQKANKNTSSDKTSENETKPEVASGENPESVPGVNSTEGNTSPQEEQKNTSTDPKYNDPVADEMKKRVSFKQKIKNMFFGNKSVETADKTDSTVSKPLTPQQKIKKICYGSGPNGRLTIKSKEFFQ